MYLDYIYGDEDDDYEDDNPYISVKPRKHEVYMNGDDDDEYDNCPPGALGERYNKLKPFNWED